MEARHDLEEEKEVDEDMALGETPVETGTPPSSQGSGERCTCSQRVLLSEEVTDHYSLSHDAGSEQQVPPVEVAATASSPGAEEEPSGHWTQR